MTDTSDAPAAAARLRAGLLASLVILAIYGGLALSVDFPRAALGIQSDTATYYLMGHSLAADGDLAYRREDLQRAYREFESGPSGIFLKRGRDITGVRFVGAPPFLSFETRPDSDPYRLFFGKSFIYPLAAAPLVRLAGTNGFLVLNALLLALAFLAAYVFISERSGATVGLLLGSAFVFATIVPGYFVWITPELFNFSLGLTAYVLWLFKEVAAGEPARGLAWLRRPATTTAAAALTGLLTFSKVTNALLAAPIVGWLLWRRRWRAAAAATAAWVLVTAALFGANIAVTGEWNYQGGERATFYGPYPFQQEGERASLAVSHGRDEAMTDVLFDRQVFWSNLAANLRYVVVGRNSGLAAYYFPAVLAVILAVWRWRAWTAWQSFVLAGLVAHALVFLISLPYTYFGGGGSIGNRYFMGLYGTAVVLLPPVRSTLVAVLPWLVGGLFVAKVVLNPFYSSYYPAEHGKAGPLRALPVELTNVNDLPINTDSARTKWWYGDNPGVGDPGFQVYYLDANAYLREEDKSFWVRGESRAEVLIKTDRPFRRLELHLSAGPVATEVAATLGGRTERIALAAGERATVTFALGEGFPYKKDRVDPAFVWVLAIESSRGFTPVLHGAPADTRFLGVRVRPMVVP